MKQIEIFLYGETYYKDKRFDNGMIFPIYLVMTIPKKVKKNVAFKNFLNQNRSTDDIVKEYREELKSEDITFKNLKWVTAHKKKWVNGVYEAHEYNQFVKGKARIIKYSNGFKQAEVKCLDEKLYVIDGIWDYDGIKLGNGCGDYFTPYERME